MDLEFHKNLVLEYFITECNPWGALDSNLRTTVLLFSLYLVI